jgi:excisionase family DNA binding protein
MDVTGEIRRDSIGAVSDHVRWLGTTEAAEKLGVVPRTLYRMIDEGQIPAYKMGRVIRLKEADLDSFLESTRVQPGELKHLYPERVDDERT